MMGKKANKKDMEIKMVDVEKIKPYERNPRVHKEAIKLLKESIQKYGYNVPILVDKNYVIITGHARYKALKELGYKKIPVIVKDMDEKTARAYRIADNKISEYSTWDYDLLREELTILDEVVVGFDSKELEKILDIIKEDTSITQKDIEKEKKEIEEKFEKAVEKKMKKLVTITCPHCLKEFEISLDDLIKEYGL